MRIAISGASGFIGRRLTAHLQARGFEVVPLGREMFEPESAQQLMDSVASCDAVVNLAGAPINRRWSRSYKAELVESRVGVTRRLVEAVNASTRTQTFISTSAVGCYPSVGCYNESSEARGTGFLAGLCAAWEAEALRVRCGVRCVITRFGVVLDPAGGAFVPLARPAKMGVAVVAGSGLQPFSWIDLEDLVRAQEFVLTHYEISGVLNFTAPQQLTMLEFVEALAAHYRSRFTLHVPAFAVRLALGEAADFALEGQCALPQRLLDEAFEFHSPTVERFLSRLSANDSGEL